MSFLEEPLRRLKYLFHRKQAEEDLAEEIRLHLERWVGSGLVVAERQFRRIVGYRAVPSLIAALDRGSETARRASSAA